ncbi:UDP-N-acetylmuramoyl-L-alanine--D-glutamate ligase [Sphingomonas astaxanthinifaciens]|uniref:UDP-N-acetylmuramoylalanine--D-glutamate ligase n=1 Tax=Sphingomonas astaxanthinifaciens DSM 22298 TaxID=1123267 RepID=A0ABQ5Z5B2_9SPHN|nr:UDP-N-acetylmuramoyl-L-alanine--D-glutamate ligase [Sphingomonas astaxanthinifaciens]GLR47211.1 UDP-N-acetylmuramoylalanine--D-glutamate ligase [Sphingomonas astaxanthinifaciens DSM 22298]
MITAGAWKNKKYAVYGLARSGLATVRALVASGAEVTAWDGDKEKREAFFEQLDVDAIADVTRHKGLSASIALEDLDEADLSKFDSLVVTPGLPLNRHPIAARAREAGVEIIGDIELFARARAELPAHKVVGITGTNGKSTTTALIHHILKTADVPTTMGGNIGLPILAQDPLPEGGVYVLELSSYQIDLTQSLDCDVAVLLNITPDHLDRYESFEAYAASKARLFEMQSWQHYGLFGADDPVSGALSGLKPVGSIGERAAVSYVERFYAADVGEVELSDDLQGPHNAQNASAALLTAKLLEIGEAAVRDGLRTYPGLPHRMERVREMGGVLFVNDSKATNAEAAAPALAAYPRIRWIVGGQAKTKELGDSERHLDHIVRAYTIGEAGPMFAELLEARGIDVTRAETLENAVKCAHEDSQPGETVLLSPACASFDQFRDFEARGDAFRRLVGDL